MKKLLNDFKFLGFAILFLGILLFMGLSWYYEVDYTPYKVYLYVGFSITLGLTTLYILKDTIWKN